MAAITCLKISSKRHKSKPRGCSRILWKKFVKRRLSTSISSSDAGLKVIIWAFSCVLPSPIWYSFSKLFSVGASPFGLPLAWACFVAAWSFKRWPVIRLKWVKQCEQSFLIIKDKVQILWEGHEICKKNSQPFILKSLKLSLHCSVD